MNPCIAMDYIESCLKIKTKSGTVVPFRLNDAQRKLYAVAKRRRKRRGRSIVKANERHAKA